MDNLADAWTRLSLSEQEGKVFNFENQGCRKECTLVAKFFTKRALTLKQLLALLNLYGECHGVFVDEENTTDPVKGDDSDFPKEYQIEILRTLKAQRENLIFDKYLAYIKNKIQELQGRKKEIEKRAITARKNFETPDYDKRKLKKHELNVFGTVTTRVKAYWKDSMSMELKKELLRIRIEDLILHLDKNIKSSNLVETVMNRVEYVKVAKKWKFSMCCCCGLRFFDAKLNVEHLKRAHLGTLSKKLQSITQEVFDLDHNAIEFSERRPAKKITEEDMSRRVFEFLDYLNNLYGLHSVSNDEAIGEPCVANYEKIVFNEDFSCVVFDERMLRGELVVPNDGAAVTSSFVEEIKLNDEEIVSKDVIVDWYKENWVYQQYAPIFIYYGMDTIVYKATHIFWSTLSKDIQKKRDPFQAFNRSTDKLLPLIQPPIPLPPNLPHTQAKL
ncbi:hypothetical protein CFP56_019941 [Quercus suber]|uniref:DUF629 domain-containing protein n=1 Tax=Quercus suber TaxID=58331 RepID=A0AAW0KG27_QUESU